jgi:N utilization substance protein B
MIQRRGARELVMKALYAHDVGKNDRRQAIELILKPRFEGQIKNYKFAKSLFNKTVRHEEELDDVIEQHIKNWRMERLTMVDKLILRAAICEFLYFPEIPTKVTINEAIEIAKKYSTPDSGKFVNGILDAALSHLNEQHKIEKKGRGLIESSSPK